MSHTHIYDTCGGCSRERAKAYEARVAELEAALRKVLMTNLASEGRDIAEFALRATYSVGDTKENKT